MLENYIAMSREAPPCDIHIISPIKFEERFRRPRNNVTQMCILRFAQISIRYLTGSHAQESSLIADSSYPKDLSRDRFAMGALHNIHEYSVCIKVVIACKLFVLQ